MQVHVEKLSKSFPGTQALRGVDLAVSPGRIHGIVGENGAGKSTLVRIISGELAPTSGSIAIDGVRRDFHSPLDALRAGIALVSQEGSLVSYFTGAENIALGSETRFAGLFIDHRRTLVEANELAERYFSGIDLPLDTLVSELAPEDVKIIEILRALRREARVLILDEPTATLQAEAKERLFEAIRRLKARGVAVVLISHFLHEILEHCDEVTVMRDGNVVDTGPTESFDEAAVIRMMIGSKSELRQEVRDLGTIPADAPPRIETRRLTGRHFFDVSFSVRPGEIVGLVGLTGAGHREFAEALYGAEPISAGSVAIDGRAVQLTSPTRARAEGVVLVPDSRMIKALFPEWTVKENLSVGHIGDVAHGSTVIRGPIERAFARNVMRSLDIRAASEEQRIEELSGGNKQKTSIGRWLYSEQRAKSYRLCIFIEPTEGVDVGAKAEIHRIIADMVRGDTAALLISSDFAEIAGLCDRILAFRSGRVVASFDHNTFSEEAAALAMSVSEGERE